MAQLEMLIKGIQWDKSVNHGSFTIFPVVGKLEVSDPNLELATDEIENIEVSELKNEEVNRVEIKSKYKGKVLFVNGQILEGGRQTRSSIRPFIINHRTKTEIPVNCVEQGRWNYTQSDGTTSTKDFKLSKRYVSSFTQSHMSTHRATQGSTWSSIMSRRNQMDLAQEEAQTENYLEIEEKMRKKDSEEIKGIKEKFLPIFALDNQRGVIIFKKNKILSVEVFENQNHWQKISDKFLESNLLDILYDKTEVEKEDIDPSLSEIKLEETESLVNEESYKATSKDLEGWAVGLNDEIMYLSMYKPQPHAVEEQIQQRYTENVYQQQEVIE
jgi:hypothetical protein